MIVKKSTRKMPYPELRGNIAQIQYPALAEIKFDGEFNWLISNPPNEPYLINKNGKIRTDCNITKWAQANLAFPFQMLGELVWGGGKAGALYDLLSHQEDNELSFRPFDLVSLSGVNLEKETLMTRIEELQRIMSPKYEGLKFVENESDVIQFFNETVAKGYEGIVVKNLHSPLVFGPCGWVKLKKKDENVYPIVAIDPVKERIEVAVDSVGVNGTTSRNVGVKCCNRDKQGLKIGDKVKIEHQGILSQGGLRHPVYKGKEL